MTDRELLALAAIAARYKELDGWTINPEKGMRWVDKDSNFVRFWNPLIDDGDALRLAIDLQLDFGQTETEVFVSRGSKIWFVEPNINQYVATRRAIVRAAAYIGGEDDS
jgi:hypothetical protein